jgi:hypothetical protein
LSTVDERLVQAHRAVELLLLDLLRLLGRGGLGVNGALIGLVRLTSGIDLGSSADPGADNGRHDSSG